MSETNDELTESLIALLSRDSVSMVLHKATTGDNVFEVVLRILPGDLNAQSDLSAEKEHILDQYLAFQE